MDDVVDSTTKLIREMSGDQRQAEMLAALHDLLIAIMHVDNTQIEILLLHVGEFKSKHTGDTDVSSDGGGSHP